MAGAFGILGLATDFRNKRTRKIAGWGWVSLIGIVASTLGGIAAERKEAAESRSNREEIRRGLVPITDPVASIEFKVRCDNDAWLRNACNREAARVEPIRGDTSAS